MSPDSSNTAGPDVDSAAGSFLDASRLAQELDTKRKGAQINNPNDAAQLDVALIDYRRACWPSVPKQDAGNVFTDRKELG